MGNFILADNQELTRYALESLILSKGDHDIYKVSDRAGLVEKLKAHENAVVLLDYTLFDFADEEQLLIVAERFAVSQWILVSDELTPQFLRRVVYASHQFSIVFKDGALKDLNDALDAVSRYTRFISQRALEAIINQQQEEESQPSILTERDRDRDSESHCPGQDHKGDCQRAVFKCPYHHHPPQEHLPQAGREHRPRSDQIRLAGRAGGLVGILHLTSKKVKRRLFTFFISRPAGYPPAGLRRLQDLC